MWRKNQHSPHELQYRIMRLCDKEKHSIMFALRDRIIKFAGCDDFHGFLSIDKNISVTFSRDYDWSVVHERHESQCDYCTTCNYYVNFNTTLKLFFFLYLLRLFYSNNNDCMSKQSTIQNIFIYLAIWVNFVNNERKMNDS